MTSERLPEVVWAVEADGASLKNMLAANEGRIFSLSLVVSLKRLQFDEDSMVCKF
jgi:hypothetical protein